MLLLIIFILATVFGTLLIQLSLKTRRTVPNDSQKFLQVSIIVVEALCLRFPTEFFLHVVRWHQTPDKKTVSTFEATFANYGRVCKLSYVTRETVFRKFNAGARVCYEIRYEFEEVTRVKWRGVAGKFSSRRAIIRKLASRNHGEPPLNYS